MNSGNKRIYLDYAAAHPMPDRVYRYIRDFAASFENPNALYLEGRTNNGEIERVRKQIADKINCSPDEIIFTSGCSEANALAVDGYIRENLTAEVYCSEVEHSSIIDNPYVLGRIPVSVKGFVDPSSIKIKDSDLVCIQHANNEIGSIQPISRISKIVHKQGGILMVDAAQTFCKLNIDVQKMGIDMLSASGSKIGALRGTGFLYVNKNVKIKPIIYGTQENGLRGGTYFDFGIKTMGVAIADSSKSRFENCRTKREWLISNLLEIDGIKLIGSQANRLANNVFVGIKGLDLDSQQLVSLLDDYGFCVSAGSACHAGEAKVSHVLKALQVPEEYTKTCLRITFGKKTSVSDLTDLVDTLKRIINMHRLEK